MARSRRDRDDDEDDDLPRRRSRNRRNEDDDLAAPPSNGMAMTAMILGIVSVCASSLTGIPAIIFGFVGMSKASKVGTGKGMAITGILLGIIFGVIVPLIAGYFIYRGVVFAKKKADEITHQVGDSMRENASRTNIRGIALACATHQSRTSSYPNPYAADPPLFNDGVAPGATNATRSWRVDILPYLSGDFSANGVYQQFNRTQRWDSATNRSIANQRINSFSSAYDATPSADTPYRGFRGKGTMFEPGAKITATGVPDGLSNTILFAEFSNAVTWTEPNDLPYYRGVNVASQLGHSGSDTVMMGFADGSARTIRKTNMNETVVRQLILRNDGEAFSGILDY